jgi:hypothetical protein
MNGNQITISVNSDDFNQLRNIARTRGQTVSDYISYLVSANLLKSSAAVSTPATTGADMKRAEPPILKTVRARAR